MPKKLTEYLITDKDILRVLDEYVDSVFNKQITKQTSLYIKHEELEILSLTIRNKHPLIYNKFKKEVGEHFFFNLILNFKKLLEKKTKRMLFLTIKNGNYVIMDSWQATKQDWEIESKTRKPTFLFLRDQYFYAKENIPGVKSLEDFIALVKIIEVEKLETLFNKATVKKLKKLQDNYIKL